jgi:hypothetical protein
MSKWTKLLHILGLLESMRKVGGDIIRYRRSLAETDAFLGKIENRGFAFLPLAREFVEERD